MSLAITGHQTLAVAGDWSWVREALLATLRELPPPLICYSSLATGADQIFAELVLARGGELRVVLPFATYEETFTAEADLESYRSLLRRAAAVEVSPNKPTASYPIGLPAGEWWISPAGSSPCGTANRRSAWAAQATSSPMR